MIILKDEDLKALGDIVGSMPTTYGLPLINFFEKLNSEQKPKENDTRQQPSAS